MSDGSRSGESAHGIPDIDPEAERDLISVYQLARVAEGARHADGRIDPDVSSHIARVAASENISGPGKLALLAHLKEQRFVLGDVMPLALALVRPDLSNAETEATTAGLFDRVRPGFGDPLGRDPLTYFLEGRPMINPSGAISTKSHPLMAGLAPSVQNTLMTIVPKCDASRRTVNGQRILYVETKVYSTAPIESFTDIVDPLNWPKCPIQHAFFETMELRPPGKSPLTDDDGWKGVVRETVNFRLNIGQMTTDLDVRYFHRAPQASINEAVGCTYSFNSSADKRITFDQGYVLVEDLQRSVGARLASSLKEVWFHEEAYNLAPKNICPVWSLATSVILFACLHHP